MPRDETTCTECGGETYPSYVKGHVCRSCYERNGHWRIRNMHRWNGEIRVREQTYRSYKHARRAFYKWVCKQELYGQLHIEREQWKGREYISHWRGVCKCSYGGFGYSHGYPTWKASRSLARDYWESEFEKHRDEIALRRTRQLFRERQSKLDDAKWQTVVKRMKKNALFFKMLAGTSALPVS